jgi:hypothetical protein
MVHLSVLNASLWLKTRIYLFAGHIVLIVLSFVVTSLCVLNSHAYHQPSHDRTADYNEQMKNEQLKVKAAFILNLARFVEWPKEPEGTEKKDVVICFYQYNFLQTFIDTILNKKINNKPISIKIITELKIQGRCEVVLIPAPVLSQFLSNNDFDNLHERITITDLSNVDESSLENKIIFRLKREKSRLRFEVNKIASERLGINIGSELLKLGILVEDQDSDMQKELQ